VQAITPFEVMNQQISTQCNPNVTHYRILSRFDEALYFQILLYPFKKQHYLPAMVFAANFKLLVKK
jgi:hypothetical protein